MAEIDHQDLLEGATEIIEEISTDMDDDQLVNAGVKTHHSPEQKYTTCYEAIPGVAGCPGSP